ncbi:hypothetical protein O5541_02660 [Escherichia coli]|nr:hypothetical protein [Escherichia coli]
MQIIEPEGKNYTITGDMIPLAELGFSPQHELSRRADDLHS